MNVNIKGTFIILLLTPFIAGCVRIPTPMPIPTMQKNTSISPALPTPTRLPSAKPPLPIPTPAISDYVFPDSIDPVKSYMFYLHGKIIEDQGLPAISPDYGEYEYAAILEKLSQYGFVVISEQRPKDTDGLEYARRVAQQVTTLLQAGVPAKNITVVGASKGAVITIYVSHLLENPEINFVIMAICAPETVQELIQGQVTLYGNILSIYDSKDELAGSCQDLFTSPEGKGLARYNEIILNIGTGHGILYKPLEAWITPTIEWTSKP